MDDERKRCLACADRPSCAKGTRLAEGLFARNLGGDEVKKRYAKDGEPPSLGRRLRPDKWRWEPQDTDTVDGLSVNSFACARTAPCSVLLHPDPDRFKHIAVVDLAALTQAVQLKIEAVYDPDPEGSENPCHFNLVPLGRSVEDLVMALKKWNDAVCNPKEKLPRTPEETARAEAEREAYERVFQVHTDVWPPRSQEEH